MIARTCLAATLAIWIGGAVAANPLDPLRDQIDMSAAQVIHIWTPEASATLATGPQRPGGRATRDDDRFVLASVSKPYVAAAVLSLIEQGRLSANAPVAGLVPVEVAAGFRGLRGITVDHLATMSTGLPDYLTDAFEQDWQDQPGGWTPERALSYAYGLPTAFAPGAQFDYSNTNYLLLELVMAQVTGQTFQAAMQDLIFDPLGLDDSAIVGTFAQQARDVAPVQDGADISAAYHSPGFGDGGVIAPAADVAAFFRALFIDEDLLAPKTLTLMVTPPDGSSYGFGIDVSDDEVFGLVYAHDGLDIGFTSSVIVLPELPAVLVLLRGDENADGDLLWDALDWVMNPE